MFNKKFLIGIVVLLSVVLNAACAPTPAPPIPTQTPLPPSPASPPTSAPTLPTPTPRTLPQATIRVGNLDRTYLYYVPANLSRNAPLLFALHGSSEDAERIRSYTQFETIADKHGFIVVYPNGYQKSWNDCRRASTYPAKSQNIDDVIFIRTLIARFQTEYGINASQVFAMGWANGGHMAFRLALELPDEIRAIAAVAANLPADDNSDCRASGKPISVLIMNGTRDSYNPYEGGRGSIGTLRSAQASAEYFAKLNGQTSPPKTMRLPHRDTSDPTSVDRTVWNDAGKPEVVLVTFNGGGHYLGIDLGQATGDLDSTGEIWEFFARQRSLK